MATPTAHTDAQGQNTIDRNVRQWKDLDLFFGKKQASKDINKVVDIQAVNHYINNEIFVFFKKSAITKTNMKMNNE